MVENCVHNKRFLHLNKDFGLFDCTETVQAAARNARLRCIESDSLCEYAFSAEFDAILCKCATNIGEYIKENHSENPN